MLDPEICTFIFENYKKLQNKGEDIIFSLWRHKGFAFKVIFFDSLILKKKANRLKKKK
jgi:hypothetical protein